MEDTTEIAYALCLARRILRTHLVRCETSYLNEVASFLDPNNSETINNLGWKTYIVSFRTSTDDTAHWESHGRSGTGFALAFGLKPLVIPGILCLPVLYEPLAQCSLISNFLDSAVEAYECLSRECHPQELNALRLRAIQWTALGIWTLAPTLKDPRFQAEREWRIILIEHKNVQAYGKVITRDVQIRRVNNREMPYKVLQYDKLPILGLELGAHAAIDENDLSLKQLLDDATLGSAVPITRSKVSVCKTL